MTVERTSIPCTLEEVCEPLELAPSLAVFEYLMAVTALALDGDATGVRWHCRFCRWHTSTPTIVMRPSHCGEPMEIEAWVSLSQLAASVPMTVDLRGVVR